MAIPFLKVSLERNFNHLAIPFLKVSLERILNHLATPFQKVSLATPFPKVVKVVKRHRYFRFVTNFLSPFARA